MRKNRAINRRQSYDQTRFHPGRIQIHFHDRTNFTIKENFTLILSEVLASKEQSVTCNTNYRSSCETTFKLLWTN